MPRPRTCCRTTRSAQLPRPTPATSATSEAKMPSGWRYTQHCLTSISLGWRPMPSSQTCPTLANSPYCPSVCFLEYLGACRRRAPTGPVPISPVKLPKSSSRRDLLMPPSGPSHLSAFAGRHAPKKMRRSDQSVHAGDESVACVLHRRRWLGRRLR